ncbi:hypothetical protein [Oceaniserpentilla sp. 4NH20-0058]
MKFKTKASIALLFALLFFVQCVNALELQKGKLAQQEYPEELSLYKEYFL